MPYAPSVADRSGEIWAQGIMSAANNIGGAITGWAQKREEEKALAAQNKALETLLKSTAANAPGVKPEDVDALLATSPDESPRQRNARLTTALTGVLTQSEQQSRGLRDRYTKAQIDALEQTTAAAAANRRDGLSQRGSLSLVMGGVPSSDELKAMLESGASIMPPSGPVPTNQGDIMRAAFAQGIDNPELLQAVARYADAAPFQPTVVDLGDGRQAMMTSPRSAVPLQSAGAPKAYAGGPQLSADAEFYLSGPGEEWKPVPKQKEGEQLDPMIVGNLEEQLAKLEAEKLEHQRETSKGDKRYGFANMSSRETRLKEIEQQIAGIKATLRVSGKEGRGRKAPAARSGGDPFSAVKW